MQILKNIYWLSSQCTPYIGFTFAANVYAIKSEDGIVITDSGGDRQIVDMIDKGLEYWGLSDYPITHVLVCHEHGWHMGNVSIFRKRGAKIVAGVDGAEAIEKGAFEVFDDTPFKLEPYIPCVVDIKAKDGDIIEAGGLKFEVIAFPGHTAGSVFYKLVMDGKTILFTGDALAVGAECKYAKLGGGPGWDLALPQRRLKYLEAIKRVSKMHADVILPSDYPQLCLRDGWRILQQGYLQALLEWRQPAEYDD